MGGSSDMSKEIERQNMQRQQSIQKGMLSIDKAFSGFNPQYYEGVRNTALGSLMPQFEQQYRRTKRGAALSLGSRGLLPGSSVAREAGNHLEQERGLGQILVGNQANQVVKQAQEGVARERNTVVGQLVSSQDPALAAQQALAGAASVGAPSITAPLGDLFQNFSNAWLARGIGKAYNEPTQGMAGGRSAPLGKNYFVKG